MRDPTILVVDDNPLTLKMVRLTLESEGHKVHEAADAAAALESVAASDPSLVITDLVLPDMRGTELLTRLRAQGCLAPAVLLTGNLSHIATLGPDSGFAHVLSKPVDPFELVEIVQRCLATPAPRSEGVVGPHVLVVDDQPSGRKLMAVQLGLRGFEVAVAKSAKDAIQHARERVPDVILSDVLMPDIDGFQLAMAVRSDPVLARVPVVLISSFCEEKDRRIARAVGASDLVLRDADLDVAADAIRKAAQEGPAPLAEGSQAQTADQLRVVARVLALQTGRSQEMARRMAIQAAALSLMSGFSEALARPGDMPVLLGDALVHCLDAAGLSVGAMFLSGADAKLQLRAMNGLPRAWTAGGAEIPHVTALLERIQAAGGVVAMTQESQDPGHRECLGWLRQREALAIPLKVESTPRGLLLLASDTQRLSQPEWLPFAKALAAQFGQAIRLAEAVAKITASEARYRELYEGVPVGLYVVTPDGIVISANGRAAEMLGYDDQDALVGTSIIPHYVNPQDRQTLVGRLQRDGSVRNFEVELRRRDETTCWMRVTSHVVGGEEGRPELYAGLLEDVNEERMLRQRLSQSQKLDSVGRLAGGIAHDFNNILGVITGYGALLHKKTPEDHPDRRRLEAIVQAAERAAGLTRQLLAFSRKQLLQPRVVAPSAIVSDLRRLLAPLVGEDIELVLKAEAAGRVMADPGQLEQVAMNLVVNARDAMPMGGTLTIETADVELDAKYVQRRHVALEPGHYVTITVSDTGTGMDEATQARVFEPFFTSKPEGKGTGLGLATVYGIVKQSGGYIWLYSELGKGTVFRVYLPRVEGQVEKAPAPPRSFGASRPKPCSSSRTSRPHASSWPRSCARKATACSWR